MRDAALNIERCWRGIISRRREGSVKDMSLHIRLIQRWWHNPNPNSNPNYHIRLLQRCWRGYSDRSRLNSMSSSAVMIQRISIGFLSRLESKRRHRASIKINNWIRTCIAIRERAALQRAAERIRDVIRAYFLRKGRRDGSTLLLNTAVSHMRSVRLLRLTLTLTLTLTLIGGRSDYSLNPPSRYKNNLEGGTLVRCRSRGMRLRI